MGFPRWHSSNFGDLLLSDRRRSSCYTLSDVLMSNRKSLHCLPLNFGVYVEINILYLEHFDRDKPSAGLRRVSLARRATEIPVQLPQALVLLVIRAEAFISELHACRNGGWVCSSCRLGLDVQTHVHYIAM